MMLFGVVLIGFCVTMLLIGIGGVLGRSMVEPACGRGSECCRATRLRVRTQHDSAQGGG